MRIIEQVPKANSMGILLKVVIHLLISTKQFSRKGDYLALAVH